MKSESDLLLLYSILKTCDDNDNSEYRNKVLKAVTETLQLVLRKDKSD